MSILHPQVEDSRAVVFARIAISKKKIEEEEKAACVADNELALKTWKDACIEGRSSANAMLRGEGRGEDGGNIYFNAMLRGEGRGEDRGNIYLQ
jgi:hypothetical protein